MDAAAARCPRGGRLGRGGRGGRAARHRRRRPRPGAVPERLHHAGAVRLGDLELRGGGAAGHPRRAGAAGCGLPLRRARRTPTAGRTRSATSTAPFSAFVFKVQAGMDTNHRDRVAFARVCSGVFERGMVATHAQTGRPFATKYAQAIFGRDRAVIDTAYPGRHHRAGQRHGADDRGHHLPRRTGELPADRDVRARALRRGHRRSTAVGTSSSGAASTSWTARASYRCCARTCAATSRRCWPPSGPMQFEVAVARMESEFGAPIRLETLAYTQARRTDAASAAELDAVRGVEVMARNDGDTAGRSRPTSGASASSSATTPTSPSSRSSPATADGVRRRSPPGKLQPQGCTLAIHVQLLSCTYDEREDQP